MSSSTTTPFPVPSEEVVITATNATFQAIIDAVTAGANPERTMRDTYNAKCDEMEAHSRNLSNMATVVRRIMADREVLITNLATLRKELKEQRHYVAALHREVELTRGESVEEGGVPEFAAWKLRRAVRERLALERREEGLISEGKRLAGLRRRESAGHEGEAMAYAIARKVAEALEREMEELGFRWVEEGAGEGAGGGTQQGA